MLQLRTYQETLVNDLRKALQSHRRVVMQLATGGGKTACFSYMAKNAFDKGNSILVITNRGELLEQAGGAFNRIDLPHGWLTADTKHLPTEWVIIAMVETLDRRLKGKKSKAFTEWLHSFELLIIDECHISSFNKILDVIHEKTFVIGATATPYRTGKMTPLSKYYNTIVNGISVTELIKKGYLSTPEYYGIPADLSTVGKQGGEFKSNDLDRVFGDKTTFTGLTKNYDRLFNGRKTIIFAPSIRSACIVLDELKKIALEPLFYVDSFVGDSERDKQLEEFYNVTNGIMVNVGILTTGYDCPTIDTVILYRATTSLPLYLQMVGRASRTTETKKHFRVIDFGDNVRRFGFWHEERTWSLENDKLPKEGVAPVKNCKSCDALIAASCKVCPYCGAVQPENKQGKKVVDVDLQEIKEIKPFKPINIENFNFKLTGKTISVPDLERMRVEKNYKLGFVLHRLKTLARFEEYAELKGYNKAWAFRQYKFINNS